MIKQQRIVGLVEVDTSTLQADESGNPVPQEIEILKAGDWSNNPNHGGFRVTDTDLDEYVANYKAGTRKGIPIDVEHRTDPVFGKQAVGWMTDLKKAGDKLVGTVDWTKTGMKLLQDKAFKYFSPEFVVKGYKDPEGKLATDRNVLIAGGITNRPLFKGLKPIVASDGGDDDTISGLNIIYADEGENQSMTLDEIRKKALGDLDPEEKKFLAEHKSELTSVEQAAYGLNGGTKPAPVVKKADDGTDDKTVVVTADDGTTQTISADEFNSLKLAAERGDKAFDAMQKAEAEKVVDGFIKADDGGSKFKPGAKEKLVAFYNSLTDAQKTVFANDVVENIQGLSADGKTAGSDDTSMNGGTIAANEDAAAQALDAEATKIMASDEGKGLKYSEALAKARVNLPEMAKQYETAQKSNGESN